MIESLEIENKLIRVIRELTRHDEGVVARYRITSLNRTPVKFQLFDPLPGSLSPEKVAFHPEFQPRHGRIDHEMAVISGALKPEGTLEVRFGVHLSTVPSTEKLERLQERARPSIELADVVESEEGEDIADELERATATRSASEADTDATPTEASPRIGTLWGQASPTEATSPEAESDAAVSGAEADAADDATTDSSATESDSDGLSGLGGDPYGPSDANGELATGISDASFPPVEERPSLSELFEADRDSPASASTDATGVSADTDGGTTRGVEAPSDDRSAEPAEVGDDATGADQSSVAVDVVGRFLEQLERDELTDEQRRRLAESLESVLTPRSLEARVEAVESKLAEFGAYVDALSAIIDVHGPPEAFLTDIRDDLSSFDASVSAIERDLETAAAERDRTADRLDGMEETIEQLSTRTERLRDRFKSLRDAHRSTSADLEDRLSGIEPVAARVDDLEADLEALSSDLEAAESRRRAVVRALRAQESASTE